MPVEKQELVKLDELKGINNLNNEYNLTDKELTQAINVDCDRTGSPQRRQGYTRRVSGDCYSTWGHTSFPYLLAVKDGTLTAYDVALNPTTIRAGLNPVFPLSFAYARGAAYWTSEGANGRVEGLTDLPFAIEAPGGIPTVAVYASGGLQAGSYQVALTYLTGAGIESGAGLAAILDVAEGQGIQLTHIPQPTDGSITTVRVYVSPANGDLLYQEIDIPVGITTVIVNYRRPGKQLETQWLRPMPRGHILRAYNGHLMVAHKNLVCWDEPYRYGLYDEAKGYTGYPERVALMEPIGEGSDSGGVFVASGKRTYFLSGNDPGKFRNALVHPYGAMEGTAARCDGAQLGLQYQGEVVVWIRSDGVYVAGMPSGQVVPIGQGRYATVLAERGASILRVQNGMRHILTTLMGTSHNGLRADDAPEATVYRNGVQVD